MTKDITNDLLIFLLGTTEPATYEEISRSLSLSTDQRGLITRTIMDDLNSKDGQLFSATFDPRNTRDKRVTLTEKGLAEAANVIKQQSH